MCSNSEDALKRCITSSVTVRICILNASVFQTVSFHYASAKVSDFLYLRSV